MAKKSRDKGGRGQRAVAKLLKEWWGADFASTPMSGGFATKKFRDDWNAAADVVTPDALFPFSVEVKWQEDWCMEQLIKSDVCEPWKWWEQCVRESPDSKIPLLVFTRNYEKWYYMVYTLDLLWYGNTPGRRLSTTDPEGKLVSVGLFSDLRTMDVETWKEAGKLRSENQ